MKKLVALLLCSGMAWGVMAQSPSDILSTIKQNYKRIYLDKEAGSPLMKELQAHQPGFIISDRVVMELQQRVPFDRNRIDAYLTHQNTDGSWSDLNYQDTKRSGWEPRLHSERILELVKAFLSPGVAYYQSPKLEKAIHKAMDYWFKAGLKCKNWYYNEIGIPRTLGTAFVLFDAYLTPEERLQAVAAMQMSKFGMTGQNKVWLAGNVMMRAVLQNDYPLVQKARDIIASEITKGGEEGIQEDWSYHQHGSQQQFGNYGLAYLYTMSIFSGIFADTPLAFSSQQLHTLSSLLSEGYRWIIWNGKMDISALGRQLFSSAPLHKALSIAFAARSLDSKVQKAAIGSPSESQLVGHKHFWHSDYTVSRRPHWMASLKMNSQRVIGVESMNGDNMRGYYMADGALYVYKDASEYYDIFPLWDWRRLPGVTAYQNAGAPMPQPVYDAPFTNLSNFVGGLSDGEQGISVMQVRKDGMSADKFWLFADSAIVCMGAGIQADSTLAVATSVEQCWKQGDVKIYREPQLRVWHRGTGYAFLQGDAQARVWNARVQGSWHDIMQMYPADTVEGDIFSIEINHGVSPDQASYAYVILPESDARSLKTMNLSSFRILQNDADMQAVSYKDVCWIAVKHPSSLELSAKVRMDFLTAGLYKVTMNQEEVLSVLYADPTQQLDTVTFLLNRVKQEAALPSGGQKGTTVTVPLQKKKNK